MPPPSGEDIARMPSKSAPGRRRARMRAATGAGVGEWRLGDMGFIRECDGERRGFYSGGAHFDNPQGRHSCRARASVASATRKLGSEP